MPELPEVETIRLGLGRLIVGKKITKTKCLDSPKSFPNSPEAVREFMQGASVVAVHRRGKALFIDLNTNYTLMIHLKMTGQLVYRPEVTKNKSVDGFAGGHPTDSLIGALPDRSTRVVIDFSDGSHLFFNDQRKFGYVKLLSTAEVANEPFVKKLGPEPLEGDFTAKDFISRIRRRNNTTVKAAILDQTTLAGVGNIYADESLWMSKLHPATRVRNISDEQLADLLQNIKDVLTLSIKQGGSTDKNYVDAEGKKGNYLKFANVFRREGASCTRHPEAEILKLRVAGRGTHICPACQVEVK